MEIENHIPLAEEILGKWREKIGKNYDGYRNHVYRVINFCLNMNDTKQDDKEKIIIASCFHDLGIWTNDTFNYLQPSSELANKYLKNIGKEQWINEIELMINMHHKITKYKNNKYPLVEVFRKADWIDVSKGKRSFNISSSFIALVLKKFPNAGFHKKLIQLTKDEFKRNPFKPLPMMRW